MSTPEQTGSLTYNGSEQSPAWLNYSSEQMLIGGTTAATDAGTYTATFTPQGLCAWLDGTSNTKQVTWTIAKAALNLSASINGTAVTVTGKGAGNAINMNHWGNVNYGGWKGTDLRYDILGATSQAPSQYNQLKSTGNVGYDATAATLLTEFEVQGARTYANDYEKNHRTQMDYYKNGNSKIKYRHDSTSSAVWWWLALLRHQL